MPNYPEQDSQSESSQSPETKYSLGKGVGVGASLPIVHSLSGYGLEGRGWKKTGTTYTKDQHTIVYNGYQWQLNGKEIIQFFEDLPK